jgi:hypothetical protein
MHEVQVLSVATACFPQNRRGNVHILLCMHMSVTELPGMPVIMIKEFYLKYSGFTFVLAHQYLLPERGFSP